MKGASWLSYYEHLGAIFHHDGHSKLPHIKVDDEHHSGDYFNPLVLTSRPFILNELVRELLVQMNLINAGGRHISSVYGSALGSITMAYEFARQLNCGFGFTEKVGKKERQVRRFSMPPSGFILVVEDVITTTNELLGTLIALEQTGALLHGTVGTLANLSGLEKVKTDKNEYRIVALSEFQLPSYEVEHCPLCKLGSHALPAKSNWPKLRGYHK